VMSDEVAALDGFGGKHTRFLNCAGARRRQVGKLGALVVEGSRHRCTRRNRTTAWSCSYRLARPGR
jgi:hypothetical protein